MAPDPDPLALVVLALLVWGVVAGLVGLLAHDLHDLGVGAGRRR